jgi:hypothetical protein
MRGEFLRLTLAGSLSLKLQVTDGETAGLMYASMTKLFSITFNDTLHSSNSL